ncbi:MAG: DUF3320 domain-containing protein [Kofleriaceae bacterium]
MRDQAAQARVELWKLSLLDLSISNPLLAAADRLHELPLTGVDPVQLARMLAHGGVFGFEAGCDPAPLESAWLHVPLASSELGRRLLAIHRATTAQLADRGEHVLWLGLGSLVWCDADGASHSAPLALWPVELERTLGGVAGSEHASLRLISAHDSIEGVQPSVNHTLLEKLRRDFDLVLSGIDGPLDLEAVMSAADGIVMSRTGWRVDRDTRLAIYSCSEIAISRDLELVNDSLTSTPVLAHLVSDQRSPFGQPSSIAAEAVTRPTASHEVNAPLDADSSQLAVVGAAAAGASFVVQGPPGTGKSQTIANVIANTLSQGKSVLFVSDKVAALDVVHQRLAAVGLGEFCLPLHAQHANRRAVVTQLGRVVERAFRPGAGPSGDDARLTELRAALDAHVAAMHKVGPFGRSLHDVIGRLVELRTTPRANLAEPDAVGLDRATFDRRKAIVERLAGTALPVEPVATHPWRASTLTKDAAADVRSRAIAALDETQQAVVALSDAVAELSKLMPGIIARTPDQLRALGSLASLAARSPRPGAELVTQLKDGRSEDISSRIALIRARGTGTVEIPRDPLAYLALATRHRTLADEVDEVFTPLVSDLDAMTLWGQLRKWSTSIGPLRFVALRNARAEVRAAAIEGQLVTDASMVVALEAVIAERACRTALHAAAEPAKRWFGDLGAGGSDLIELDLEKLDAAVTWSAELRRAFDAVQLTGGEGARILAWRALVALVAGGPSETTGSVDLAPFTRVAMAVARWTPALDKLSRTVGITVEALGAGDDHLPALQERVETMRHAISSLADWVAFHGARCEAKIAGVDPSIIAIERGDLGAAELANAWERATLLAWGDAELAAIPALSRFHGAAHHAQVSAFTDLDRGSLALARARTLVRLAERVPQYIAPKGSGTGTEPSDELGTLMREVKHDTRLALRELFGGLPTVLPKLAPVMMMTPAAVARYLDPKLPKFDLVVFDESSRLPMVCALGALARANAAIVVGDSKQLPPPRFASRDQGLVASLGGQAGPASVEVESVLDAFLAAKLPELALACHYRSKHEDVIAFANQHYYGDRLVVLPTASHSQELGVSWRRVNGTAVGEANLVEAEAVVAEVMSRLRDPSQRTRSLGVATFSRAQQAVIETLLDQALAAEPFLASSLEPRDVSTDAARGPVEPVIVRTLDAFQGEDRDVVLVSVGIAPCELVAESAQPARLDLGVLGEPGGERWLAVATTRAREQLVVFSSVSPEELEAIDGFGRGARDLAALLAFARAGGGVSRAELAPRPPASPVTAAIARALTDRGWTLRHQVGCGPYRIDLAVVDPRDPDRHVLAIEHDGACYAATATARDRDRLRAQMLAQLGWRTHRIWTLDWWLDPDREINRAHAAIVTSVAASRQRRPVTAAPRLARATSSIATGSKPVEHQPPPQVAAIAEGSGPNDVVTPASGSAPSSAPIKIARGSIPIGPYTVAAIPAGRRSPDDLFAPKHLAELTKVVEQVLAAEAPMTIELLARRVGAYFGIGRVTQRVTEQVRSALEGRGRWGDEQDVIWRLDQDPTSVPPVRVAGHVAAGRREIDEVPLSEVAAAVRIVVERAGGIAANDLVRDTARLLGFARITDRVTDRVARGLQQATASELIQIAEGKAFLPPGVAR